MASLSSGTHSEQTQFSRWTSGGLFTAIAVGIASSGALALAQEDGKGSVTSTASSGGAAGAQVDSAKQSGAQRKGPVARPQPSAFGLGVGSGLLGEPRLMLGPGGGGGSAPQGQSANSLGPLPEFPSDLKPITPGPSADFSGVEIRRRVRPDLLPDGPNPTEAAAIALKDRIRYRALKARVMVEAEVAGALEASRKAASEREMRLALKRHYELLFARMREMDPSLEGLISERETEAHLALQEVLPR